MWDTLWLDARLATMTSGSGRPFGAIEPGALAVKDGRIAWVGRRDALDGAPEKLAKKVHWIEGRWITPGLIDPHTHLVHAGLRTDDFERRLEGSSYAEIAQAGGGIRATVAATRAAEPAALYDAAGERLTALMAEGVTTLEIKSGYGLDTENELKLLRVARRLARNHPVDIATTFLGGHAVAPEYDGDPEGYVRAVTKEMLPAVMDARLADAADAFCDPVAFTPEQTARMLQAARAHGLPVKLHADLFADTGGAALAARYGALSADHLLRTSARGVAALARAGTVATLLPGAFYCLREAQAPPIDALRRAGVPIALASDYNPGSAPVTSLLTVLSMACTLFRLTPEEALAGVTRNAARALGLAESRGTLQAGKLADLCVWEIERPAELAYRVGYNPLVYVVKNGRERG